MGKHKRKRHAWSLAKMVSECKSSPTVYLALMQMRAERGGVLTPTREELCERTGLHRNTVTKALSALDAGGWIRRTHKLVGENGELSTLLRITLRRAQFLCVTGAEPANLRRAQKTCATENNSPSRRSAQKKCADSLKREGGKAAAESPPPSPPWMKKNVDADIDGVISKAVVGG